MSEANSNVKLKAAFSGLFCLGLGQVYNGKIVQGVLVVLTFIASCYLSFAIGRWGVFFCGLGFAINFGIWFAAAYYAYKKASDGNVVPTWKKVFRVFFVIITTILLVIVSKTKKQFMPAENFYVPSGSMYPAIHMGESIFVDYTAYENHDPQRGDIVVFIFPDDHKTYFVKRIVGLPNEKIGWKDHFPSINEKPFTEKEIGSSSAEENARYFSNDRNPSHKIYSESFDGGSYPIAVGVAPSIGDLGYSSVPANNYYVAGDHRESSNDSRFWGTVERKLILGKALYISWPQNEKGTFETHRLGRSLYE